VGLETASVAASCRQRLSSCILGWKQLDRRPRAHGTVGKADLKQTASSTPGKES